MAIALGILVSVDRSQNQHGWERKSVRQYICGAALEKCEVREYLPEGVLDDGRGEGGVKRLFSVLQQRAVPSSAEISNTKTGLSGQHELERFNKFRVIYKKEGKGKKQTSLTTISVPLRHGSSTSFLKKVKALRGRYDCYV